jgi:hypothetical protein
MRCTTRKQQDPEQRPDIDFRFVWRDRSGGLTRLAERDMLAERGQRLEVLCFDTRLVFWRSPLQRSPGVLHRFPEFLLDGVLPGFLGAYRGILHSLTEAGLGLLRAPGSPRVRGEPGRSRVRSRRPTGLASGVRRRWPASTWPYLTSIQVVSPPELRSASVSSSICT